MSKNIFCIGELLIDMVCVDNKGLKDGEKFEKKAGGAPANVAACISKLDGNAYFFRTSWRRLLWETFNRTAKRFKYKY